MSDESPIPAMTIAPEPTPEELAAIVSAVTASIAAHHAPDNESRQPETSRWARAGRIDAQQGIGNGNKDRFRSR